MTTFRHPAAPVKARLDRPIVYEAIKEHHLPRRGVEKTPYIREADRGNVNKHASAAKDTGKFVHAAPKRNVGAFINYRRNPQPSGSPKLLRVMEGSCPYRQETKPIVQLGSGTTLVGNQKNHKGLSVSRKARLYIRSLSHKIARVRWMKVAFEDLLLLISYSMFAASGILALVAISMFLYDAQISMKSRI